MGRFVAVCGYVEAHHAIPDEDSMPQTTSRLQALSGLLAFESGAGAYGVRASCLERWGAPMEVCPAAVSPAAGLPSRQSGSRDAAAERAFARIRPGGKLYQVLLAIADSGHGGVSVPELSVLTGLPRAEVSSVVVRLRCKHLLCRTGRRRSFRYAIFVPRQGRRSG